MEISSPALSSYAEQGSVQETGSFEGQNLIFSLAKKKNKGGIFAKLLDGLVNTGKKEVVKPNSSANIGFLGLSGLEKADKNTLNKASVNKKPNNSTFTFEFYTEDGAFGGISVFPRQDQEIDQLDQSKISVKSRNFRDFSREIIKTEDFKPDFLNEKSNEEMDFSELVSGRFEAGKSANRDKTRGAFKSAELGDTSSRQSEAELKIASKGTADQGSFWGNEVENRKLSEFRGKKARFNLEVRDLRTGPDSTQTAGKDASVAELTKTAGISSSGPQPLEIEIPVDLQAGKAGGESDRAAGKNASAASFEEALARELNGGLATDIVRDATLIIRNGGEGTIRLSLHPASLGNVKIRLEMTENKIVGHVIVETDEALQAFERELPVLEKAFRDSGFSETALNMSLAQDSRNFSSREEWQEGEIPSISPVTAASHYDAGPAEIIRPETLSAHERRAVNLLV